MTTALANNNGKHTPSVLDAVTPGLVLKLTPPRLRKSQLVREKLRLIRENADDVEVILVEAPAGYGKTSLLAQWRLDWLHNGASVAWLDLDSEESITSLASGIIEGLRRATGLSEFGHDALEAIRRGSGLTQAATALLAEIAEYAHPTVVILDNGERPKGPELLELCNYMLHNLPPNLKIVIGSRIRLPLAIGDLLAHGNLLQINIKNLQFDLDETYALLAKKLGDKATVELAARLHDFTEGWPLGLQLAITAISQTDDPEQSLQQFSHSGDEATQQLLSGFLAYLPTELADFILRCSLLDTLHPALCEAITGSPDAITSLEQLRSETPLLTSIENSDWLRLHPLVREYLRSKASQSLGTEEQKEIHQRAWHWLADHGDAEHAARHALAAGFSHEAFALIADSLYDSCMKEGHYGTVADWLSRLPEAEIFRNNALRLTAGWQAALIGNWKRAEYFVGSLVEPPCTETELYGEALAILAVGNSRAERLDAAEHYCTAFPQNAPDSLASRSITHIRAFSALFRGATEEARYLISSSPSDNRFFAQEVFHARSLGHIYLWEGRPTLAEDAVRRRHALCEVVAGRRNEMTMALASVLAAACWERDARDEARALLAFRFNLNERPGSMMWSERSYLVQASIAASEGDEPRAFSLLEALTSVGTSQGILSIRLMGLTERIRMHAARHRTGQCTKLLEDLDNLFTQEFTFVPAALHPLLHLYRNLAHSFATLNSDQPATARNWLEAAWQVAQQLNRGREMVQIQAMQAVLLDRQGESPDELLNAALGRAESGGQVRVFADTLPEVTELISRWSITDKAQTIVSPGFLLQVLEAAGSDSSEAQPVTAQKITAAASAFLTPKETEVLNLLAGGLPNKRIAATMGLSSETIKWHMKKLFIKLNAGNRQHAVDRARLLGLIS
jgi:LuxR family maltose regulon positive regulatory protein